ncbi:ribosome maturation protein [Aspergillus avenaceus]|uniref:Ribosome maturation protein n=1 Tax=Aspergillus avenaceus TaxID=36643 RepID=A0A5N6TMA3_ASPAV|nr:ribosome maturation protein [Aspergillus avenaceus]
MPRANESTSKVFYKGNSEDFIVFVDGIQILNNWRKDRSIPLADVVNGWKIFVTHKHGTQGILDGASKGILESEFGTSNEDDCIIKILENGDYQSSVTKERQGDTDVSNGPVGISR